MALNFYPKIGEVVECYFGEYPEPPLPRPFDNVMKPEIRKRRMSIVLNPKLPNGCMLVVPVSSSGSHTSNAVQRGIHVYLPPNLFHMTSMYDNRDRWALAECIAHVSKERLFPIQHNRVTMRKQLPTEYITLIQRSVIKTILAQSLLAPDPVPDAAAAATPATSGTTKGVQQQQS